MSNGIEPAAGGTITEAEPLRDWQGNPVTVQLHRPFPIAEDAQVRWMVDGREVACMTRAEWLKLRPGLLQAIGNEIAAEALQMQWREETAEMHVHARKAADEFQERLDALDKAKGR